MAESMMARGKAERDKQAQAHYIEAAHNFTAMAARLNDVVVDGLAPRDASMVYCGTLIGQSIGMEELIMNDRIDPTPKPN